MAAVVLCTPYYALISNSINHRLGIGDLPTREWANSPALVPAVALTSPRFNLIWGLGRMTNRGALSDVFPHRLVTETGFFGAGF
jgi:hypothetical protein